MLDPGDKVHVIERRVFEGDLRRHFAGEVVKSNDVAFVAMGYDFTFDADSDRYLRAPDRSTRIVSMTDSRVLVRLLPKETSVDEIRYEYADRVVVTDGKGFRLDITEFDPRR